MRLKNKTALITGGASGFGAGICAKFIAEGARVIVADIDGEAASTMARSLGESAIANTVDVSSNESVAQCAAETKKVFGELDILVNNAGVTHLPAELDAITEADFDRVIAVNAKSVYLMAKHFIPAVLVLDLSYLGITRQKVS